jgi:muramoyltetrapeptide carboxypeptidase
VSPWPSSLRAGDLVAVIAPSSPVEAEAAGAGIATLEGWGLEVLDLVPPATEGYLAGADDARAAAFERALETEGLRAIFCARGGYGAMRLLERPLPSARPEVWLVGSSDATALHAAWIASRRHGAVYGPMPATEAFTDAEGTNRELLRQLLFGELDTIELVGRTIVAGRVRAPVVGGCLSLVAALAGTPASIDARGAILALEDVGEPAYRIDRLLTTLRLSGFLRGVAGVAVGSLHRCGLDDDEADALLADRLGDLGVPVVSGLGFGHGPRQLPLLLGGPGVTLWAGEDATLRQPVPHPPRQASGA